MEKLKLVKGNTIPSLKWQQLLLQSSQPSIYLSPEYLNNLTNKWEAVVKNSITKTTFILPFAVKKKIGIKIAYLPFFMQKTGFIGRISSEDAHDCILFLKHKFHAVLICVDYPNQLNKKSVWKNNFTLPLNTSYQNLVKNYSTNHRRNLKKAVDLSIAQTLNFEKIISLFKKSDKAKITKYTKKDYAAFHQLCSIQKLNHQLKVIEVHHNETLICGAIFFTYQQQLLFIFSAQTKEAKNYAALFYLIDRVIFQYSNHELILDFEGAQDPNLARFYKSFGAINKPYQFLDIQQAIIKLLRNVF